MSIFLGVLVKEVAPNRWLVETGGTLRVVVVKPGHRYEIAPGFAVTEEDRRLAFWLVKCALGTRPRHYTPRKREARRHA